MKVLDFLKVVHLLSNFYFSFLGSDIGLATATVGLLASVILGMVLVNIAAKCGWVKHSKMSSATSRWAMKGINEFDDRTSAGQLTVTPDSIDTVAFHLMVAGVAVGLGYALRSGLVALEGEFWIFSRLSSKIRIISVSHGV